ncbi:MAG: hypothetical protein ACO3NF_15140, partial [Paracoccaceae bacterium]
MRTGVRPSPIILTMLRMLNIMESLNWGLAAALGTILLLAVLVLYWTYDKIVGIDNVKLGG